MNIKSKFLVSISICTILGLSATGFLIAKDAKGKGAISHRDPQQHIHKAPESALPVQDRPGTISGELNPNAIPEHVAFELFMRSLLPQASNDSEREQRRIQLFAKDAGFSEEGEMKLLLRLAEKFSKEIEVLDKQATSIKDKTWPNPSENTVKQLLDLDAKRVALAQDYLNKLSTKMGFTENSPTGKKIWR